ncbi:MAG: helix-turn-helix domain-containing protein [Ruminococcus sp.]|nr:helix-turn-helix domain-containing protein [Ruminococcus sp.]
MKRRHNDLFKMPNDIFSAPLNATELMVLAAVYSLRSRSVYKGRKYVKVNQKTIATLCGLKTTATVSKAINKLLRLGYIERIDRYYDDYKKLGSFVYTIPVIRGRAYFFVNRRFFKYHLTAAQTRMYLYCCKCADSRSKRFWNSYNDICSALHLKRSAVIQTVKELIVLGLLKKYRVRKKDGSYSDNHYKVVAFKPPRIRRKGKRRSRLALGFSQSNICVKLFYKYILKHNRKNVNTLHIYFFDLRGSPKIFSTLLVPTFNTNRERKRLKLYLEYRWYLGQDFLKKQKQLRLAQIRAKPPPS